MFETPDDDAGPVGFLDVAANALAVVIIVTLFAVQALEIRTVWRGDPRASDAPALAFPVKPSHALGPFTRFWIVEETGVALWRHDWAAEIMWSEGDIDADLPEGRTTVASLARRGNDIDMFRASWLPTPDGLVRRPLPDDKAIAAFLDELETTFVTKRVAPMFLVHESGMGLFTRISRQLMHDERQMCWRWWPLRYDRTFQFRRLRSVRNVRC